MALLEIEQRRSWPTGRGMQQLKRQLLKQVQQKRRKDGPLEDWTEKELAGECSTEEAAVEAAPAKEEEDGPLEDWAEKGLAGECSN